MISRRSLCWIAVCCLGVAALPARRAVAQDSPRIATVNPAKVFNEMQETKDLKQKMEADRKTITDEGQRRAKEVEDAKQRRGLFNEGTDDFNKANKEYLEKVIAAQAWQELIKADLQRQQKSQMKSLFEKIEQATKEVAEARKLDIVIVEQKTDLPADLDQINVDQLRGLINQRTVLYNNGKFDITNEVLQRVDEKYKTKK
ncbi:MAG TPA: OmpH family outer membrane protein [Tepidisphaeraceae bacterium]|jgi:Skp family chaperone for outer membrane proteins